MDRGDRAFIVGLAVALFGGALVVGLVALLFSAASPGTRTVTAAPVKAPAASAAPAAPAVSDPEVIAGGIVFTRFACSACHGLHGQGGVSPDVPALTGAGKEFTTAQLRDIINHGAGVVDNPQHAFMPVWGAVISDAQVAELVAYVKAGLPSVAGAVPLAVPAGARPETAGAILYESKGCINCHGANGFGGVPNPASPDKSIPTLTGADFRKQFNTSAKIAAVISDGSVIGKAPIASMPHWGGILSAQQIQDLVAYIGTLK